MIIKQNHYVVNKRWVYKLDALGLEKSKPASNDDTQEIVPIIQPPKLIISEESEDKTRKYAVFSGYPELYRYVAYYKHVNGHPPSLYEVCPYYMKMHFDIDMSTEELDEDIVQNKEIKVLYPILVAFKDVLNNKFNNIFGDRNFVETIIITQSHTLDKISYHIIQDSYFMSNWECRELYEETKKLLQDRKYTIQAECIDSSVYKPNQNFRIYGCCKKNKKNVKNEYTGPNLVFGEYEYSHANLIKRLKNKYEIHECITPSSLKILSASLLSNTITCTRLSLDSVVLQSQSTQKNSIRGKTRETNGEDKLVCDLFFKNSLSMTPTGEPAFSPSAAITGRILTFSRLRPSHCSLCDRVHDEENIFLKTEINNDVFYYCRRALDNKKKTNKIYIGNITSSE